MQVLHIFHFQSNDHTSLQGRSKHFFDKCKCVRVYPVWRRPIPARGGMQICENILYMKRARPSDGCDECVCVDL